MDSGMVRFSDIISIHTNLPINSSNFDFDSFWTAFSSLRMIPIIDLNNVHFKSRESKLI